MIIEEGNRRFWYIMLWQLHAASTSNAKEKQCYSHVTTLRDISNAFPSVTHESMNEMLSRCTDSFTRQQIKARHEQLEVRIHNKAGEGLIIHPGSGGAQGDKIMPVQFRKIYEAKVERWVDKRNAELDSWITGRDPVTDISVDVTVTCYADDVKEINLACSDKDALENIATSTVLLDKEIQPAGLSQNAGKAEHIATFLGPGQDSFTKDFKNA